MTIMMVIERMLVGSEERGKMQPFVMARIRGGKEQIESRNGQPYSVERIPYYHYGGKIRRRQGIEGAQAKIRTVCVTVGEQF